MDVVLDGKKGATPHDVLETYGPLFKHPSARAITKLFLNGGLRPNEANDLINSGKIDVAVFAWSWIAKPDLQIRTEKGAEIEAMPDVAQLYHSKNDDSKSGYSDYPKGKYLWRHNVQSS